MHREELLLAESIERTLDEAHTAVVALHEANQRATPGTIEDPNDTAQEDATDNLGYYIEKVFLDTALLAERLGAPQFAALIESERKSRRKLTKHVYTDHDELPHFPHLARARSHFQSLRALTDAAATTAHDVLETMLKNTAKVIVQQGVAPDNEAKVRNAMLEALKVGFEDVFKEVPIAKLFKTYKADIGVPSLRAVIEYKYVRSLAEMDACLEGIYADMKGYGGDDAWRNFYAVFYMTEPFYRQDQVEEDFALVGADVSWKPIVVVGQPTAVAKSAASAKAAKTSKAAKVVTPAKS